MLPCKVSCTSSRLSSPLSRWPLGFVPSSSATWSLAITLGLLLLLVLRSPTKASWPQPRIASLRPIRPRCLTASALFLCPLIIICWIVISSLCAIIADVLALASATIPLASSSADLVIALVSFLLGASLFTAAYASRSLSQRFYLSSRPSRFSSLRWVLSASLEAVSAIFLLVRKF